MLTKISLKPVIRRKDSSSAAGAERADAICDRNAIAASGVKTFASTAACRSLSLYIGVVLVRPIPLPRACYGIGVLLCQYSVALVTSPLAGRGTPHARRAADERRTSGREPLRSGCALPPPHRGRINEPHPSAINAFMTFIDCSLPDCGTISPVRSMIFSHAAATPSGVRSSSASATPGVIVT